jgi:sirohydrochlorin cobaltochelatase
MGHGTHHEANASYSKLQDELVSKGNDNYYIGTVEGSPALEDVITAVKKNGYSKVVLQPLMVVAGDHANNDMAGDEEGSWKLAFEAEGIDVECVLRGLGSIEAVQDMYVSHTADAIK